MLFQHINNRRAYILLLYLFVPCLSFAQVYAYVINASSNSIDVFKVDNAGKFETSTKRSYTTSMDPEDWSIYNNGDNIETISWYENKISSFAINKQTGALSPISPRDLVIGIYPWLLAISPNGKCGYSGNYGDNTLSAVQILPTGKINLVKNYSTLYVRPAGTRVDVNGDYLFAVYQSNNKIVSYKINKSTCEITPTDFSYTTSTQPSRMRAVKLKNNRQFLYVVNSGDNSINEFEININGSLVPIAKIQTGGIDPMNFFTPDGINGYVPNRSSNTVSWFTINTDGSLMLKKTYSTYGMSSRSISFDKLAQNMYVANQQSNDFSHFKINTDGSLSFVEKISSGGIQPFGVSFLELP